MTLYLDLEQNPIGTAQQKGEMVRGGRIHHYTKKKVATQMAIYENAIREALDGREPPMFEDAVYLDITFYYQIKQQKRWGQWKTSKPDLDNSVKSLQDVMTRMGFWKDDSQIALLKLKKRLSEHPGILIETGRLIQP